MAIQNSVPTDPRHGIARLAEARRMLRWARGWLSEFGEHARCARFDDTERTVFAILVALNNAHETLLDASWHLGARRARDELLEMRSTDPLLSYLRRAGNNDTAQTSILAWHKHSSPEVLVVEPSRTLGWTLLRDPLFPGRELEFLFRYLFAVDSREALARRMDADPSPVAGREKASGVRVRYGLNTVLFREFETRDARGHVTRVPAPTRHLGVALEPIAHAALDKALAFFDAKAEHMQALTRGNRPSALG